MTPTLPARNYHDPDTFSKEQAAIFQRSWLLAGHATSVPSPTGACAVEVGGRSVLLVRPEGGELRAFHNTCRHRAAPLLWADTAAACKTLRCRYHGWRYGLDGALLATPSFGESVSGEDSGLWPVHLRQWRGLLFVNFDADPLPLKTLISGIDAATVGLPLEAMVAFKTARHTLRCNWKTYVENYLEGYHIPVLHPSLNQEISMRDYRVEMAGRCAIHQVPTRDGALNQGFWAWIWPNAALNFYGAGMSLERMCPISPTEMEIRYTYLAPADTPVEAREQAVAISQEVTAEDVQICEAVQRNLEAGIYTTGRLSPRHENGVAAFQQWVAETLG